MRIRTKAAAGLTTFLVTTAMAAVWGPPASADTNAVQPSVLAILAHPDDDLLFMEPDLKQDYDVPTTTVYVTGGDATNHGDPGKEFPDPCAYSASRFDGLRAAHSRGIQNPTWTKAAITIDGHVIEEDTLNQRRTTKLVFLRLHEAGNGHFKSEPPDPKDGDFANIYDLFAHPNSRFKERSEGSDPGDGDRPGGNDCDPQWAHQTYNREDLLLTFTDLMERYQASTVLSLDPNVGYPYKDLNIDHIGVSRFVGVASQGWHGPENKGHLLLRDYRTYTIDADPGNLDPATFADKQDEFLTYVGPNRHATEKDYSGQNDPEPNPYNDFYSKFLHREYPRWTNGVAWTALDSTGRLNAVAMLDNKVQIWRENASGGTWTGPIPVPGSVPLASTLTLIKDGFGTLHIVGIRLADNQIVTTAENAAGTWGPWTVLGNPNSNPDQQVLTGNPAVVAERDGRLTVFVRNWGSGVSMLRQNPDGSWPSDWADIKGYLVRDDITAGLAPDGHVELFAPSIGGLLHWSENPDTGAYPIDPVPVGPPTAGPVSISRNSDGRMQIFYVQADTGKVATQWQRPTGFWTTTSGAIGPFGLEGVSANAGSDGRMTLATRNPGGGVSLLVQDAPNIGFSNFPDLGNVILGAPVVALDRRGRQVVLAFERDGALHVARQSAPGAGSPYGQWELAGS
ncbi:PIG-L family deacetylase [Catenulispora sp. NF23]|uniref:PIG-L family deacetylase n=1 Tax=Catenulispora pinistramenti TaxID=2705254 RepID=UPI001BADE5E7|nr:PIG-L family deacetylase [Catenulispora pinistramenti]MBS2536720.1 PIG-L family deacetylase [Catenulispora pinistramenti]